MVKKYLIGSGLLVAVLLCWQIAPVTVGPTQSQPFPDGCQSTASSASGCYTVCPKGDGSRLDAIGSTITVIVKDATGNPIAGIPASDFWVFGCNDHLFLVAGSASIDADGPTDASGQTTISGSLMAGGCDLAGLSVVVQGVVLLDQTCQQWLCLPIETVSPDMAPTGAPDGVVDIVDLSVFAGGYTSPPKPYDPCLDFGCGSAVDLIDFSIFAQHYLHP
jgi:hypothetical protein